MINGKEIYLRLYVSEIASNVMALCNAMGENFEGDETMPNIVEYLSHPDGEEYKPIVARGLEEALYNVRLVMQRYLVSGTTVDENLLRALWSVDSAKTEVRLNLELDMPMDFNVGVTKALISLVHEYITDFILYRYLYQRLPDFAKNWKDISDSVLQEIKETLSARVRALRRSASWV